MCLFLLAESSIHPLLLYKIYGEQQSQGVMGSSFLPASPSVVGIAVMWCFSWLSDDSILFLLRMLCQVKE
nr:hypothetical protein XfCFBP8356_00650 [Xylella fastidiosa subsp. sandyi]